MHTIKIENITDDDYHRLQRLAAAPNGDYWFRECAPMIRDALNAADSLSLRNLTRMLMLISPALRGNPTGNKGKPIKQPKGKKRGVRRPKSELGS